METVININSSKEAKYSRHSVLIITTTSYRGANFLKILASQLLKKLQGWSTRLVNTIRTWLLEIMSIIAQSCSKTQTRSTAQCRHISNRFLRENAQCTTTQKLHQQMELQRCRRVSHPIKQKARNK